MYAVIRSGGKQYRVEPGQRLEVERLKVDGSAADAGTEVDLAPVLVVDGSTVLATPAQLGQARVRREWSATPRVRRSGGSPTSRSRTSAGGGVTVRRSR